MKIAIIGGGITGLSTAIALEQRGFEVQVYEKAEALNEVGAGIWLQPNALKALDKLGLGQKLRKAGAMLSSADISNLDLSPVRANPEDWLKQKDHQILSIHRARLQKILLQALPEGTVRLGHAYQKHENTDYGLKVKVGNQTIFPDLLLAADGIHSPVRKSLIPGKMERSSGQVCWRGIANFALPQPFAGKGTEAWGPNIRFGFAPISTNETYWFAVEKGDFSLKKEGKAAKNHVQNTFNPFASLVGEIIEATPAEKIIFGPLGDLKRLEKWHFGKICLLGDAAHATTPNMGQGAGQGIEDAWFIAEELEKEPSERAFPVFEQKRRKKVDYVVNNSWRFGQNAHRSLGRFFMKTAMKFAPRKMMEKQLKQLWTLK